MTALPARKQSHPENVSSDEVVEILRVLARNLKIFREMCNLTQENVARTIGSTVSSVAKWEGGYSVPRPEWLTSLAKLYGVHVANLFGERVPEKKRGKKRTGKK